MDIFRGEMSETLCAERESDPRLLLGREQYYHYIIGAGTGSHFNNFFKAKNVGLLLAAFDLATRGFGPRTSWLPYYSD